MTDWITLFIPISSALGTEGAKRFISLIPKKVLPLVSAAIGAVAAQFVGDGTVVQEAVVGGVLGLATSGAYDLYQNTVVKG